MADGIVITGIGLITPIGNDRASVLDSLRQQRHGFEPVEWFPGCSIRVAGTIKDFSTEGFVRATWRWPARYHVPRETLRSMPPHCLWAFCAMEQALQDAGVAHGEIQDGRTGLFCASAGSARFLNRHVSEIGESAGQRANPWAVVSSIAGTLNFNLAAHYGIKGAVTGFVSACSAGAHAIGYASDEIALGRQRRMIVVGAEEPFWESLMPFTGLRALSRQTDLEVASRPFDRNRDGFVGSGGAAVVVLESGEDARRRGARIHAEIAGWGQSADGHSVAQSDPEGAGLAAAIRNALHSARVSVGEIDYVNAHATSTPVGDRAEALALRTVLGAARPVVSSTKGLTGHPLSMSGVLEAAICSMALTEGFMPGNAHLVEPGPECEGLFLPRENLDRRPKVILSNSSGFGGSNVALVLRAR